MYTSKVTNNLRMNRPNQGNSIQTDAYVLSTNEIIIAPIHSQQVSQQRFAGQQQSENAVPTTATPVFAYPTIASPQKV